MTSSSNAEPMSPKERTAYEVARARDIAFDAVHSLWRRREAAGMTQADLARILDRDEAWVSRNLNGPGNWTIRTLATLVGGLDGELEIKVLALEDPVPSNYDAYDELLGESRLFPGTATDNTDYKRTWNDVGQADVFLEDANQGVVVVEMKKRR